MIRSTEDYLVAQNNDGQEGIIGFIGLVPCSKVITLVILLVFLRKLGVLQANTTNAKSEGNVYEITNLCVQPEHRQRGVASELLSQVGGGYCRHDPWSRR
jgi:ribosomal protein S18 acetylase RimI-like enzyme